MDELWTFDGISDVWVPLVGSVGTLVLSGASLFIALSAHKLASKTAEREHERTEDDRRREDRRLRTDEHARLVSEMYAWASRRFTTDEPDVPARTTEISEIDARTKLSQVMFADDVGTALWLLNARLTSLEDTLAQDLDVDVESLLSARAIAGGIVGTWISTWAADGWSLPQEPARIVEQFERRFKEATGKPAPGVMPT